MYLKLKERTYDPCRRGRERRKWRAKESRNGHKKWRGKVGTKLTTNPNMSATRHCHARGLQCREGKAGLAACLSLYATLVTPRRRSREFSDMT